MAKKDTNGAPADGGAIEAAAAEAAAELDAMGCYEVSLGDTTGIGTPHAVRTLVDTVVDGKVANERVYFDPTVFDTAVKQATA
mgnify:CR=1 FL=1